MQSIHKQLSTIARTNTTPIDVPRSTRTVPIMVGTTIPAGRLTPVAAFHMHREDAMKSSTIYAKVDLMEAAEAVRNPIRVRFRAIFVPYLAFAKFDGGMDEFNRSYTKTANANGQPLTPFFETINSGALGSIPIHRYLGFHAPANTQVNDAYIRAYNVTVNWLMRNRSESLYQARRRLETDTSLAPAFWNHEQFKYVVPDWDDQAMEGSVDLSFTSSNIPVEGLGFVNTGVNRTVQNTLETGRTAVVNRTGFLIEGAGGSTGPGENLFFAAANSAGYPEIFANIAASGVKISLANIAMAEKARWWAEMKAQFEGLGADVASLNYVIDLLMQGISVPDRAWQQPILVNDQTVVANLDKRWATDGANLASAMVNGEAECMMRLVMPRCPTGGIMMIVAEILPDQIFERMEDPLLFTTDVAQLPHAMNDDMDPQKVDRISNRMIDTSHTVPNGLFGYAPKHWKWQASYSRLGGKFFRSAPSSTFNQDRAQFWTVEQQDPSYNADFMISANMNQLPFVLLNVDVGEAMLMGQAVIEGNTVFGERLLENDNAYNEVLAGVDKTRITKGV